MTSDMLHVNCKIEILAYLTSIIQIEVFPLFMILDNLKMTMNG